jgi:hypothetical protein
MLTPHPTKILIIEDYTSPFLKGEGIVNSEISGIDGVSYQDKK